MLTPESIATSMYQAIQEVSNFSDRSLQSKEFKAGVSDLGFCSERTRRMLDQQVPHDTDVLAAWIGTALGDYAEQAALRVWPHGIVQAEVSVRLEGESGRVYTLSGHPDLILGPEGVLVDFKTSYGLSNARRSGPSRQQQFQRHCYAKAAWEAGYFGDRPLAEVQVANVWIDRSAVEKELYPHMEPFDEGYVMAAGAWLDDVVYAYLQGEEARKEPPRELCAVACGFYDVCRAYDTDVEGLILDPAALNAVDLYREGNEMERQGKRLKDQAKQHLVGFSGSTGEYLVRWTRVNDSVVPESHRRGYDKLDVKPLPKPKGKK